MNAAPTILVLDDERPQLLAMRVTLSRIGTLKEFSDPNLALDYVRKNRVEAAIVDVHLPRFEINGLDFISDLRSFDPDLSVIVRTADDSSDTADKSIEQRAFRRAVKHKTSPKHLQEMVKAAVSETLKRRQVSSDAANSAAVKSELIATIGSVEDELAVSDNVRATCRDLRNQLTALGGIAEALEARLNNHPEAFVREQISENRKLVLKAIGSLNLFLDGPWAGANLSSDRMNCAQVNGVLEALRRWHECLPSSSIYGFQLSVRKLFEDAYVASPPVKLITALRHLVEFSTGQAVQGSIVQLIAETFASSVHEENRSEDSDFFKFRTGGKVIPPPFVEFTIRAVQTSVSLIDIRRAFEDEPLRMKNGNLQMVELALAGYAAELSVFVSGKQNIEFILKVPVHC